MKRDEDIPAAEVLPYRRALWNLPRSHRAMVHRLIRAMHLALEAGPLEPDEEPADELARAEARRILDAHGRRDGAA